MDNLIQAINSFWGDSLKTISPEQIEEFTLSPLNKSILIEIGLPSEDDIISFYFDSRIQECVLDNNRVLIIGDDYGTQIGVSLNVDAKDAIYSIDISNESPIRFINSDILKLLQFLLLYKKLKSSMIESTDEEAITLISKTRDEFAKIDRKALADENNWWSVILEQHEDGIM